MREGAEVADPFWLGERSTLGKAAEAEEPSEPMLTMLPERCLPRELAEDAACQARPCMRPHELLGLRTEQALQVAGVSAASLHSHELLSGPWWAVLATRPGMHACGSQHHAGLPALGAGHCWLGCKPHARSA